MARAEIKARATLDSRGFQTGIAKMNQGVKRFTGGQLRQVGSMIGGAFAVGAVVSFTKNLFQTADAIDNTAKQLGVGVEQLQALQRETELTAGSADKMTAALGRIAKAQAQAAGGEATPLRAFKQLGITFNEISRLNPAQLFERISKAVTEQGRTSEAASGASLILGRSYTELNTVMQNVADEGLQEMTDRMLETSQIMSEEMVKSADKLEESWNKATRSVTTSLQKFFLWVVERMQYVGAFWGGVFDGLSLDEADANARQTIAIQSKAQDLAFGGKDDAGEETTRRRRISVSSPKSSDSLAKIGGIIGGQSDPMRQVAERQLKISEQMAVDIGKMNRSLEGIEQNTEALEE